MRVDLDDLFMSGRAEDHIHDVADMFEPGPLKELVKDVVGFLWDFRKFFDTVDPVILAAKLVKANYPETDWIQALAVHSAPRVVQFAGASSLPVVPERSILSGCAQSIPLTRAYLGDEFTEVKADDADIHQAVLVDDVSHLVASSKGAVLSKALSLAKRVAGAAGRLLLNFSFSKSVVLALRPALLRSISRLFK